MPTDLLHRELHSSRAHSERILARRPDHRALGIGDHLGDLRVDVDTEYLDLVFHSLTLHSLTCGDCAIIVFADEHLRFRMRSQHRVSDRTSLVDLIAFLFVRDLDVEAQPAPC